MTDTKKAVALSAVIRYLGGQYEKRVEIVDEIPAHVNKYMHLTGKVLPEKYWCFYVPSDADYKGTRRFVILSESCEVIIFDSRVTD